MKKRIEVAFLGVEEDGGDVECDKCLRRWWCRGELKTNEHCCEYYVEACTKLCVLA